MSKNNSPGKGKKFLTQKDKKFLLIGFGIITVIAIISILLFILTGSERKTVSQNNAQPEIQPTGITETGTLICEDCAAAGMKINVWTHPDRSGIAFSVPSGTQIKITDSQIYEGIKYYKIKYGSKTGWIRDSFVQKDIQKDN